jgi:hypothetical protein
MNGSGTGFPYVLTEVLNVNCSAEEGLITLVTLIMRVPNEPVDKFGIEIVLVAFRTMYKLLAKALLLIIIETESMLEVVGKVMFTCLLLLMAKTLNVKS